MGWGEKWQKWVCVVHYKAEKPCNQCEKTFMKFAKYVGIQIDIGQNGTHKIHDDN